MEGEPTNSLAEVTTHQLRSGRSLAAFALNWQLTASTAQAPCGASGCQPLWCSSARGLADLEYHQTREDCVVPHCTVQKYCRNHLQVLTGQQICFSCPWQSFCWCILTATALSCCQIKDFLCCSNHFHCSVDKALVNLQGVLGRLFKLEQHYWYQQHW